MGISSSQIRFLAMTARMNSISRENQGLSLQKIRLAGESQEISKKYNEALNSTILKWSANNGVDYVDLQYNTLMRPNSVNANNPRLITDEDGRVVLDNKYAKILRESGFTWPADRSKILSEVTGLDVNKLAEYNKLEKVLQGIKLGIGSNASGVEYSVLEDFLSDNGITGIDTTGLGESNYKDIPSAEAALNNWKKIYNSTLDKKSAAGLLDFLRQNGCLQSADAKDNNGVSIWASANVRQWGPSTAAEVCSAISTDLKAMLPGLKTFLQTTDDVWNSFETTFNSHVNNTLLTAVNNAEKEKKSTVNDTGFSVTVNEDGTIKVNLDLKSLLETAFAGFEQFYDEKNKAYIGRKNSDKYKDANGDYITPTTADTQITLIEGYIDKLYKIYDQVNNLKKQVFDSEADRLIAFYDKMFNAVADNGYIVDLNINDKDYFNQMLQNNKYYITTISENGLYEDAPTDGSNDSRTVTQKRKYNYRTTTASNYANIFAVNDDKMRNEALAEYEYEKSIINKKEKRIDTRMANLNLEMQSLKNMMESVKNTINSNIDRVFSANG